MDKQQESKLVVCLGNPGEQYANSRHNAGWQTAKRILAKSANSEVCRFQPTCGCLYKLESADGNPFHLLLPMTYMNNSGVAVKETLDILGIAPPGMLVICDCMDLPVGRLRLRSHGSSAGQRGVESVISELQTDAFARLRVGIGRPEPGFEVVDYVLADWVSAESSLVNYMLDAAADCCLKWIDNGFDAACRMASECSADKFNAIG